MQNCPKCNTSLDPSIGVDGKTRNPQPTDFSVCTNCISVLKFDGALKFALATRLEAETMALQKPEDYRKISSAQNRIAIGNGNPYRKN